ncbi:uncharacterized protein YecT (DUF1311 family) [Altererythrobacter atlanticus]|uniref:Lysozyme inhibitor LprI-like N-terminal domain-containing protein n=1 Tax=Croceibacterium atlanticum TaxID=1267766 RepID=A0A0F7KZF3_9SPHN|nr:lysozyme inhibitor LprI family protein [Croceibacterium atlanticum]AKH44215.1 hypothetical protein WYH_03196 [Croceibacterium atlanticum]MBB5732526.1 uncharacterized protein YecT (DUF1311 family) [Croceibacterium atlanticum]
MIILPLLAAAAQAATPNPEWNCDDPVQQQEMNWCAQQDFLAADEALNTQWDATASRMKQRDMVYDTSHDGRPGYFEQLLEAQRAWLKYRDAHCATDGYLARGGSLEPLLVATCKTALTKTRIEELHDIEVWPE